MTIIAQSEFRNILLVHSGPTSSDTSSQLHPFAGAVDVEARILEDFGHQVTRLAVHGRVVSQGGFALPAVPLIPTQEQQERENFAELMKLEQFNLIHFHHTMPLVHPGIYAAARASQKPVVLTLHVPLSDRPHLHHPPGSHDSPGPHDPQGPQDLSRFIDLFIVPTPAQQSALIQSGIDAQRIGIKPYALPSDLGGGNGRAGFSLYVGSLDADSGVDQILGAFTKSGIRTPLKIVGSGPLQADCISMARLHPHIQFLGVQSRVRTIELMKDASLMILPRPTARNFLLLEAAATGLPILAFELPGVADLIIPQVTGILCTPAQLAIKAVSLLADKPALSALRKSTRAHFLANHTPVKSHETLIELYHQAAEIRLNRIRDGR